MNASKTELVLFTRRTKLPVHKIPVLDETVLEPKDEAKYLGVILDKQLYWGPNVEARRKKGLIAWCTSNKQ